MLFERTEEAEALHRYCVGYMVEGVASRLGKHIRWVQTRLKHFAAQIAAGGIGSNTPIVGNHRGALEDVSRVVVELDT